MPPAVSHRARPERLLIVLSGQWPQGSNLLEPLEDQFDFATIADTTPETLGLRIQPPKLGEHITNLAVIYVWGLTSMTRLWLSP